MTYLNSWYNNMTLVQSKTIFIHLLAGIITNTDLLHESLTRILLLIRIYYLVLLIMNFNFSSWRRPRQPSQTAIADKKTYRVRALMRSWAPVSSRPCDVWPNRCRTLGYTIRGDKITYIYNWWENSFTLFFEVHTTWQKKKCMAKIQ